MGRWSRPSLLLLNLIIATRKTNFSLIPNLACSLKPINISFCSNQSFQLFSFRSFSAVPSAALDYNDDYDCGFHDFDQNYVFDSKEDDDVGKIPVKAYFLCTSIDLKRMQAENLSNIVPPTSRSSKSNCIALRYCDFPSDITSIEFEEKASCWSYMVVFHYGSTVLFNIEDHEVESYLDIVRRYASGLLPEMRKDDYAVKERPMLVEDMQGGPDYIVLKKFDTDGIRTIGSVLGQSIALDYFVSQVDGLVEEFTDINRDMEKTGTFTMRRKKLFQLVGKANSNLADVIIKVGLFERSEIAWRNAKYAQIFEYLREEYEVAQRFGNLDFKLKFVEHNIHFLQEVLQNRKSDLLEWCIICLLSIQNVLSIYEIVLESSGGPL